MPENIDAKRYIDKKERYSHTLRERFDKREIPSFQELFSHSQSVTAQDSCDMRDRLLRYFATCGQEKPLSGSLKRGEKNA